MKFAYRKYNSYRYILAFDNEADRDRYCMFGDGITYVHEHNVPIRHMAALKHSGTRQLDITTSIRHTVALVEGGNHHADSA